MSYGRCWGGGGLLKWLSDSSGRKDINLDGVFTNDIIVTRGTCTDCHFAFMSKKDIDPGAPEVLVDLRYKTWNHHLAENAQEGNCIHCHGTVRTVAAGSSWCVVQGSRVPKQPPCAYCHVDAEKAYDDVLGNGDWQLQYFDFIADGFNTPLTKMTSTTHSIPNIGSDYTSPVVIHDFAVCFECHDNTDMMVGMVDGDSNPVFNPTSDPIIDPNKVFPYHASGMSLDLTGASNTEIDPGPGNWFPIDRSTGYTHATEAALDDVANSGTLHGTNSSGDGTNVIADDSVYYGPGVSDDMFFAYHYHPGRGGIVGTTDVIGGVSNQVGSFNVLFPIFTPYTSSTPKYYDQGPEEDSKTIKNFYKNSSKAYNTNYHSANFGTGGSTSPTASPNCDYTDTYLNNWNFCNRVNVPYTDYKIAPNPATDLYWSTVPYFESSTVPFPIINDEVRLLKVDCGAVPAVVEAWSKQTTDYYANGSEIIPDLGDGVHQPPDPTKFYLQVDTGGGYGANENMSWDGTKWSVEPSSCFTGDKLRVTSTIGGGSGSASFTVP